MANVNGQCAVKNCKGKLLCAEYIEKVNPVIAATFYEKEQSICSLLFGNSN